MGDCLSSCDVCGIYFHEHDRKDHKCKEKKPQVWRDWVEANRRAGRADPVPLGPDLKAGKILGVAIPDAARRVQILELYLADRDVYLVRTGHALRNLQARINAYLNPGVKARDQWTQEDWNNDFAEEQYRQALRAKRAAPPNALTVHGRDGVEYVERDEMRR